MGWADRAIAQLRAGEVARCRPHGGSMRGRIESGQLVTLDPRVEPEVGHAVMCRLRGNVLVHLISAQKGHGDKRRFLIANNLGKTNGWVSRQAIYGVVTQVEGAYLAMAAQRERTMLAPQMKGLVDVLPRGETR